MLEVRQLDQDLRKRRCVINGLMSAVRKIQTGCALILSQRGGVGWLDKNAAKANIFIFYFIMGYGMVEGTGIGHGSRVTLTLSSMRAVGVGGKAKETGNRRGKGMSGAVIYDVVLMIKESV